MEDKKKKIIKEKEHFGRLLANAKDETIRVRLANKLQDLDAQLGALGGAPLVEASFELVAAPSAFEQAFQTYRQALWYQAHRKSVPVAVQEAVKAAESNLEGWDAYRDAQMLEHAPDGRHLSVLPTKPEPFTLYVAPTHPLARQLALAGYPAVSWVTSEPLNAFLGVEIVLTHPSLHAFAESLDSNRFSVICVDCWPQGQLDVVGTVPPGVHLLTLGEMLDVVPIQGALRMREGVKLHKLLEQDNESEYRRLARKLVAA